MNNNWKVTIGTWIQAIGTVLSAISSTPSVSLSLRQRTDLNVWGNVLQATGNGLVADSENDFNLDKLGSMIQASGNSTVLTGLLIDFKEKTKEELDIKGNLLQALGAGTALSSTVEKNPSTKELYSVYGYLLQLIGNSLQALSGNIKLRNRDGEDLKALGSWIQAIGTNIIALGVTR